MTHNTSDIQIALDEFYRSRDQEYQLLKRMFKEDKEENETLYCNTLTLFLYAQLEGFIIDILSYYIECLNTYNLTIEQTIPAIADHQNLILLINMKTN
ncbi:MAG: hypothetical protein ACRCV3_03540 [Desulfovibrionaceae bacterium]